MSLLGFDLSSLPVRVTAAELRLYVSSSPGTNSVVAVVGIRESWDPATVDWAKVFGGSFYDDSQVSALTIPAFAPGFYSVNVMAIVDQVRQAGGHGFLVLTNIDAMNFDPSRAPNPPTLIIW